MTESQTYSIRWRGRQFGPYTIQEINRKLDEHEIGLGHEVLYDNKWISVDEFLLALRPAATVSDGAKRLPSSQPASSSMRPGPSATSSAAGPKRVTLPAQTSARIDAPAHPAEAAANSDLAVERRRHRLIYAMLAILLGYLGVHNFYARHWLTGLFQLLLTLATFILGFGIIATWVWALVEAVVIRKDGYGMNMS